jgi:hypothetical protein
MIRPGWVLASILLLGLAPQATAQVEAFRFDSTRVPVGRLYEYLKTNRDGSHAGQVSLYVAGISRIESLKWEPGHTTAVLVVAFLDWSRFSVRRFESWALNRAAAPEARATLETEADGSGVRVSFLPESLIVIRRWPWHSYDFDFASLNLTLAHLIAPEAPFSFERADVVYRPPLSFADLGPVNVRFVRREQRSDRPARLYELEGPGLQGQRGKLWTAVDGGHLVEFEFPFPDEPGYRDVRFQLQSIRSLSPSEWESYKRERVEDGPARPEN